MVVYSYNFYILLIKVKFCIFKKFLIFMVELLYRDVLDFNDEIFIFIFLLKELINIFFVICNILGILLIIWLFKYIILGV